MSSPLLLAMRRLLQLGRPHWRILGFAFVGMTVVGLTTGAYAWLMGPALRFLLTGGQAGLGRVTQVATIFEGLDRNRLLVALPIVVVIIGAVKGLGYLGQFYFAGLFGQLVVMDLRRRIFEKLLRLSPTQRAARLTGDLLSRFTADVASVEQAATYTVASWLRDSVSIVVLITVAVWWSWKLALLAFVVVPVAVVPAARLTRSLMKRTREGQTSLGLIAGQVQEGLGALRTIQAFNAEGLEAERFAVTTRTVERALERAGWARAGVPGIMEILASIAIAGSLGYALSSRVVEADALISFLGALILLYQPAKDLGRVSQFALTAAAALERIEDVLSLPDGVHSAPGAIELGALKVAISVEALSFSWVSGDGSLRPALDGVTLTIPAGKVTAIVGESGSGKSTLTSLLLRFEQPSAGTIRVDGVDVASATVASTRAQFALVTQEALLFSATVRENLLIANPAATDAQLEAACTVAAAHAFIQQLPQGYDTPLGERGVTLSGGQKQRLCLARAVLANAPVLVLDEATSNLDSQSEREVLAALDVVLAGRTAVVIAHRLSSIRKADSIVVLDAGRVVEQGTQAELLAKNGVYAAMWARQHV